MSSRLEPSRRTAQGAVPAVLGCTLESSTDPGPIPVANS